MIGSARVFSLQTTKISNPFAISGGNPEVDQCTAAALCQGMRREWYLSARLKWALDWSVAQELEYLLCVDGTKFARRGRWKIPKGREYVQKMAGLAVMEVADPKNWQFDKQRAGFMGVSKSQFSRTWLKRYNVIYTILDDWANSAFSYVRIKQRYEGQMTS